MTRLLIVLTLSLSAFHAAAQTDRQLVDRFDRAEASGRPRPALVAALEIVERYPESSVWAFNAGRMHARLDETDPALEQLGRSADLGYSGIASFSQHADLETLRGTEAFEAIVEKVRANAEKRMAEFRAEAEAYRPPTHVPDGAGESPALIIALHGTGGKGLEMLDRARTAADELGAVLVAPDALRPAGEGFSWTFRDESEWFVLRLIEKAVEQHSVDPDRVVLLGFSQGANIGLVMARTHADTFAGVVPVCGHYEENNASIEGVPARTYFVTGSRDPWRRTYINGKKDFESHGGETRLKTVPGMGHDMPPAEVLGEAIRWCLEPGEG